MATNPNEADGWVIDPSNPNRAVYTDPTTGFQYEAFKEAEEAPQAPVQAKSGAPAPQTPRGISDRFKDSYNEAGQYGGPGLVAREYYKNFSNYTPEQIAQAQKTLHQEAARRNEADPVFRDDDNWLQTFGLMDRPDGSNVAEQGAAYLLGQILGGADPTQLFMPGSTAGARILGQIGIGGASDAFYQAREIADKVRDEFNVTEMLASAGLSGAFQGGVEAPAFIKELFKRRGIDTTPTADPRQRKGTPYDPSSLKNPDAPALEVEVTGGRQMTPEERLAQEAQDFRAAPEMTAEELFAPKPRQTLEEEAAAFQGSREPTVEDVFGEAAPAPSREPAPTDLFPEETPEYIPSPRQQMAVDRINELTGSWENAPSIEVHENFDGLDGIDPEAIGVTRPDGSIAINLDAIEKNAARTGLSEDDFLSGVTFHEGLGHFGLVQRFGDDLDNLLDNLYYKGSANFRQSVDDWMEANPDAYAGTGKELTRAVEEILAETSERGAIERSMMDQIKDFIKKYGRELGLNLEYSDREIRSILGMAHDAVRNGKNRDVIGNGFKYLRVWHGSPHDFDRFDHSRMGSGEGAQVYGWGTYLTDTKTVAEGYRDVLTVKHHGTANGTIDAGARKEIAERLDLSDQGKSLLRIAAEGKEPLEYLQRTYATYRDRIHNTRNEWRAAIDKTRTLEKGNFLDRMRSKSARKKANAIWDEYQKQVRTRDEALKLYDEFAKTKKGRLYEVDIPDENWLMWDLPAKDQPEVIEALRRQDIHVLTREERNALDNQIDEAVDRLREVRGMRTPEADRIRAEVDELNYIRRMSINADRSAGDVYREAGYILGPKRTSQILREAGIIGNKYLDGFSRKGGNGTYNYVVFDENDATIVNKYMKPRDNMSMSRREGERKALAAKARDARYAKLAENWDREQELFWSPEEGDLSKGLGNKYSRPRNLTPEARDRVDEALLKEFEENPEKIQAIRSAAYDRVVGANESIEPRPYVAALKKQQNADEGTWRTTDEVERGIKAGDEAVDQWLRKRREELSQEAALDDKNIMEVANDFDAESNKYMRPKKDKPKAPPKHIGKINVENITNAKDIDYILGQSADRIMENNPDFGEVVPRPVTIREAQEMGLTPSKLMKPGMDETGLAARIEAGASLLAYQTGKIQKLLDRSVGVSDREAKNIQRQLIKEFATLEAIHGRVANNNSEVGRALNILNRARSATQTTDDLLKYMAAQGNQVLSNPAMLSQLQQQMASIPTTAGKVKMARAAMKKGAEDYIFRVWYNMLLSAPPTHVANFAGTAGNFVADLLEGAGAAAIGQFRGRNADRIRAREVGYRVWGAIKALQDANTWSKARQSLNTGLTGNMPNVKAGSGGAASNVYTGSNPVLGVASGILESPTRALAGADEWWRNVLHLSSIYGLAVRNSGNKGLKGSAFWDEVRDLINNPTPEMIKASNDYTKTLQFLDRPSWIADRVIKAQTPGPNAGITERVGTAGLKFFVPFVRTPDSLIRTALRRTPVGLLERENVNGWKAGGAERDKVVARLTMGSMLAAFIASQAMEGNITGQGPSDYRKKAEWLGSHQENSIKVGDEWISIAGLEPVSTNITGIATIVERLKSGDVDEAGYFEMAGDAVRGIANVLVENSYMEGLQSLSEIFSSDEQKQGNALQNFLAGLAGSITTPAIVRKYAQTQDPAVRDTTGDGSFGDRVGGRMASGVPGLSEKLPQRYDVYGRPMSRDFAGPNMMSRAATRPVETDPTIKEIERLASKTDQVVFGAPKKSGIKVNGKERRLTAEEFQAYQALSGAWALKEVEAAMADPEWSTLSDEEKTDWIKNIVKDIREASREYLFNPDGDEEGLSESTNEE